MKQATVLAVITVLGSLALAVVIGGIVLAYNDKSLPGELIAIGSAAAGAIGGILSRADSEPQEVTVENTPLPVSEEGHIDVGLVGLVCIVLVVGFLLLLALDVVNIT